MTDYNESSGAVAQDARADPADIMVAWVISIPHADFRD